MLTLICGIIDLVKTKTRPWRHIYHDIEIPRLKSHDIEVPRTKNHDIEKRRHISHDIVIPRRFFRGQKATTSRFQGQKATTSSSCGILTLMPPDKSETVSRSGLPGLGIYEMRPDRGSQIAGY